MKRKRWAIIVCIMLCAMMFSLTTTPFVMKNYSEKHTVTSEKTSPAEVRSAADWWPMYGHDPAHTGLSTSTGPETNQTLYINTIVGTPRYSGISVVNGKIYLHVDRTSEDLTHLFCIHGLNGNTIFDQTFPLGLSGVPATDGENLYLGSYDKNLYGIDAQTGDIIWSNTIGFISASPTLAEGKLYIGSLFGNKMMCIDTNGNSVWNQTISGGTSSTAAVVDGKVYVGWNDNKVYCLNALNGAMIWNYTTGGSTANNAPVVSEGKVLIGSEDGKLYYFDADDGRVIWNFSSDKFQYPGTPRTPAVYQGKIYVGISVKFYCIDLTTGTSLWNFTAVGTIYSTPAIAEDGNVYFGDGYSAFCLNGNTGQKIWQYDTTNQYSFREAFALSNRVVYVYGNRNLYAFGSNQPPQKPQLPTGPTQGEAGREYTFTALTVDPELDTISYMFDWGDGSVSDWTDFVPSNTITYVSHRWTNAGEYNIKVKAKDILGSESTWSEPFLISLSSPVVLKQLDITAPSSVVENTTFQVTVTAETQPVEGCNVTFNSETKTTTINGQVTFTAPTVETTRVYIITATKAGYNQGTAVITVFHQEEQQQDKGWIFGLVTDASGTSLADASVCIQITDDTNKCVQTDDQGRYYILATPGSHTVSASKQGYTTMSTPNIPVTERVAIEANFILTQQLTPTPDENKGFIEYTIQKEVSTKTIGARIDVGSGTKEISYYTDDLTIDMQSIEQTVSFTLSAPEGTTGTIIVLKIGNSVLSDLDNIAFTYDGNTITEYTDPAAFFAPQDTTNPAWLRAVTLDGLYVFVRIPHFSTHAITISSLPGLGGILIGLIYLVSGIVALLVFVIPAFKGPYPPIYFQKKGRG